MPLRYGRPFHRGDSCGLAEHSRFLQTWAFVLPKDAATAEESLLEGAAEAGNHDDDVFQGQHPFDAFPSLNRLLWWATA